ncbi:hypothetical protein CCO03_14005 [Comamonas serinivorans]|uniref:Lipoprotein n=1 Tax=Comamonas serinivorans TaxID=1082851 RepID=A0A1Y0EQH1_9BURK|nr:hypothetical protein [Comamonas serinivorans]ARU05651.1 hypothetical protein CCO03_14005 [Comamonas serinivorans]
MKTVKALFALSAIPLLFGCATVRQQDLAAWDGVPVEALDTHPLFLSMPMYKTFSDSGMEIRNYVNGKTTEQCFASAGSHQGHHHYGAFMSCSENRLVCNNLFYIQKRKVVRYAPTGDCYTDERVRPQSSMVAPRPAK